MMYYKNFFENSQYFRFSSDASTWREIVIINMKYIHCFNSNNINNDNVQQATSAPSWGSYLIHIDRCQCMDGCIDRQTDGLSMDNNNTSCGRKTQTYQQKEKNASTNWTYLTYYLSLWYKKKKQIMDKGTNVWLILHTSMLSTVVWKLWWAYDGVS